MSLPEPRYVEPASAVDVTDVAIQNRHLFRPSDELNDLVLGVFGRAQRMYDMRLCAISVMSTHYHIIPVPEDAENLARFMCFVKTNLSKEIGRVHDWKGSMFAHRYHLVAIAPFEEAAQIARLKYVLAAGVKEFLVDRVADWPGVHSATALLEGQPLVGHWFNRTKEYAARKLRGEEDVDPMDFATEEQLILSPPPCCEHLPEAEWRRNVADLIVEIEEEGSAGAQAETEEIFGVEEDSARAPAQAPTEGGEISETAISRDHGFGETADAGSVHGRGRPSGLDGVFDRLGAAQGGRPRRSFPAGRTPGGNLPTRTSVRSFHGAVSRSAGMRPWPRRLCREGRVAEATGKL